MQAKDIMTTNVVSVGPETEVREIARLMLERSISAVPVVDEDGRVLGIVSEGDLTSRPKSGTGRQPSWWLALLPSPEEQAREYAKALGQRAKDVMTREVMTVTEDMSLEGIAMILERGRIKRVPVVRDGKLVGIVSRANVLHGIVAQAAEPPSATRDRAIREAITHALSQASGLARFVSVVVSDGTVHLWGTVQSEEEKQEAHAAAASAPNIKGVHDHVSVRPLMLQARF